MEEMNWDAAKVGLDALQWMVTLGVALWVYIDRGRSNNADAIKSLNEQQSSLSSRINVVESKLDHMPSHTEISDLKAEISGFKSELKALSHQVNRIADFLMESKS